MVCKKCHLLGEQDDGSDDVHRAVPRPTKPTNGLLDQIVDTLSFLDMGETPAQRHCEDQNYGDDTAISEPLSNE